MGSEGPDNSFIIFLYNLTVERRLCLCKQFIS